MSSTVMSGMVDPLLARRLFARSRKFTSRSTSFSSSQLMSRKSIDSAPRSWLSDVCGEIDWPSMLSTALIALSTCAYSS